LGNKPAGHGYWSGMAKRYRALAPPLRISDSEREIYQQLTAAWYENGPCPRVLVLGATPDFYHLPWPKHSDLLAVDLSAQMLSEVWPGNESQSLCQNWATMDLPPASRDIVLCDGGLSFFSYPDQLQQLADNLGRIIAPGGLFLVRLYLDADYRETPAEIFEQLLQNRIRNSSELKLRLWFALNSSDGAGVRLADVWHSFHAACPNPKMLTESMSWPEVEVASMNAYKNLQNTYFFPTIEQVTEIWARSGSGFAVEANITPEGPCHQHLRVLSLRRNP